MNLSQRTHHLTTPNLLPNPPNISSIASPASKNLRSAACSVSPPSSARKQAIHAA